MDTATEAIIDWSAAFCISKGFMSDGTSHLKNETLFLLAKELHTPHNFTLPYCLWYNGAVERLGKELFRITRSLLFELQQITDSWAQLVLVTQSVINNPRSLQRNGVAPIIAFTDGPFPHKFSSSFAPATPFLKLSPKRSAGRVSTYSTSSLHWTSCIPSSSSL